jgi:hypothetical protein
LASWPRRHKSSTAIAQPKYTGRLAAVTTTLKKVKAPAVESL